jgi:hypothetical protein
MTSCTAKSKRSGQGCKRAPTPGRPVCNIHGGRSPVGIAVNTFRTGRYSKYLPERLAERYREATADGELLALREDIALIDARLADVLGRVDSGESGATWKACRDTLAEYRTAKDALKYVEANAALDRLAELIDHGLEDYAAWADVRSLVDQRARLVANERRRLVEMQQMITAERAMTMLGAVVAIIRRHIRDRETLAAISADFGALALAEPGAPDRVGVA